jgi:hypothetical protein
MCCQLNTDKTKVITFTKKISTINPVYKLCDKCITHSDSIKDLVDLLGSTFFFQSLKILWHTHALTYPFPTIDSLILSYFTLVKYKLEYALPACNIMTTNASKLECVKWKSAALSLSQYFFPHIPYSYAVALELLQLHTVQHVTVQHLSHCSYILSRWQGSTWAAAVTYCRVCDSAALELLQLHTVQYVTGQHLSCCSYILYSMWQGSTWAAAVTYCTVCDRAALESCCSYILYSMWQGSTLMLVFY